MSSGSLQLVATPIGNLGDISARALEAMRNADDIVCEDTRHTRKLLTHFEINGKNLVAMHQHNENEVADRILDRVEHGHDVVVVSDAGMPAVSDPGYRLVRAAHERGVELSVIPGPSSVLSALVVSGFATDRFVFEGFLPQKRKDRDARLHEISKEQRTVVLFEAPHRLAALVDELIDVCGEERLVALAKELTKMHESVWRGSLGDAASFLEANPPKGEYVITLEGAPAHSQAAVSDEELRERVLARIAGGSSTKDAAMAVATEYSVSKHRVYEIANQKP